MIEELFGCFVTFYFSGQDIFIQVYFVGKVAKVFSKDFHNFLFDWEGVIVMISASFILSFSKYVL